jgi:hypothetical protein
LRCLKKKQASISIGKLNPRVFTVATVKPANVTK